MWFTRIPISKNWYRILFRSRRTLLLYKWRNWKCTHSTRTTTLWFILWKNVMEKWKSCYKTHEHSFEERCKVHCNFGRLQLRKWLSLLACIYTGYSEIVAVLKKSEEHCQFWRCSSFTYFIYIFLNTPATFPSILQSGTMIGSIVEFSGCRRIWSFSL